MRNFYLFVDIARQTRMFPNTPEMMKNAKIGRTQQSGSLSSLGHLQLIIICARRTSTQPPLPRQQILGGAQVHFSPLLLLTASQFSPRCGGDQETRVTASLRPVTQLGVSAPVRHNLMDRGLTLARKCHRLVKHQEICLILKINILNNFRNVKYVDNMQVLSENGKI